MRSKRHEMRRVLAALRHRCVRPAVYQASLLPKMLAGATYSLHESVPTQEPSSLREARFLFPLRGNLTATIYIGFRVGSVFPTLSSKGFPNPSLAAGVCCSLFLSFLGLLLSDPGIGERQHLRRLDRPRDGKLRRCCVHESDGGALQSFHRPRRTANIRITDQR